MRAGDATSERSSFERSVLPRLLRHEARARGERGCVQFLCTLGGRHLLLKIPLVAFTAIWWHGIYCCLLYLCTYVFAHGCSFAHLLARAHVTTEIIEHKMQVKSLSVILNLWSMSFPLTKQLTCPLDAVFALVYF